MSEILIALLGGAAGSAFITAVGAIILYKIKRKDEVKDHRAERAQQEAEDHSIEQQALRYIMLYIIQERGKTLIAAGEATMEEKQSLRQWHTLYHDKKNGLGGNGDADVVMAAVDALPLKIN